MRTKFAKRNLADSAPTCWHAPSSTLLSRVFTSLTSLGEIDDHPQKCCLSASVGSNHYKGIRSVGTPVRDGASRIQRLYSPGELNETPERIARLRFRRSTHHTPDANGSPGSLLRGRQSRESATTNASSERTGTAMVTAQTSASPNMDASA
jgi:hypothetical protein